MADLHELLASVRHPGRYLGGEVNAVRKDPDRVRARIALAYPELYELGMSYLGFHVLYAAVNLHPALSAERVFAPDLDMERALRRAGEPLRSLETGTPLGAFDAIGFSLQHELNLPDVLVMLELAGVPTRAEERGDGHPVVLAGGPGAANPEPLAEALDAVFLGEADRALPALLHALGEERRRGAPRRDQLARLQSFPGVYLPARHRPRYAADGRLAAIEPLPGAPARVERVLEPDLGALPPPARPVVPWLQTVHDRLTLEIQRGCTRGCRFCQAGMITRPVRQRALPALLAAVDEGLAATGHDEVGLLSLSAGDHPQILAVLAGVLGRHAGDCVSVSLPSLRAETLTPALAEQVRGVRKSGFTIAPEAGSERLRRVINKDLTDADVLAAALGAFAAGWQQIKLYFMIGLPTETAADRAGIVALTARLREELRRAGHRPEIHVGVSTFVPKAHTPFQWEAMTPPEAAQAMHAELRADLRRIPGVKLGWTRPEMAWAEGLLARGDRRQFAALQALARGGARLQAWSEHFDQAAFAAAFAALPVSGGAEHYLRARAADEPLPWDHLQAGPTRAFLRRELERALAGEPTPDCARAECAGCGACAEGVAPQVVTALAPPAVAAAPAFGARAPATPTLQRIRLRLARRGPAAFLSQLETLTALHRALRRAGWPLAHSGGFHPKPRLAFGPACPVGVESESELLDVGLRRAEEPAALVAALERALPAGLTVLEARPLAPGEPGPSAVAGAVRYRLTWAGAPAPEEAARRAAELLARPRWVVEREAKGARRSVDLRPGLRGLRVEDGARAVRLDVAVNAGAVPRPAELAEALGLTRPRVVREALLPPPVAEEATP